MVSASNVYFEQTIQLLYEKEENVSMANILQQQIEISVYSSLAEKSLSERGVHPFKSIF